MYFFFFSNLLFISIFGIFLKLPAFFGSDHFVDFLVVAAAAAATTAAAAAANAAAAAAAAREAH